MGIESNTLVYTNSGYIKASELEDDKIYAVKDGNGLISVNTLCYIKEMLIEPVSKVCIIKSAISEPVVCSPSQMFLAMKDGNTEWIKADELEDCYVCSPINAIVNSKIEQRLEKEKIFIQKDESYEYGMDYNSQFNVLAGVSAIEMVTGNIKYIVRETDDWIYDKERNCIWSRVTDVINRKYKTTVYSIVPETGEGYVAQNIIIKT